MNIDTFADELTQFVLSAPDAEGSTVTGTGVDIRDYDGQLKISQNTGTITGGSSPTLNGKLQHSDSSGSGYADVSSGAFTEVDASDDDQSITVHTRNLKRYVRYVGTIAGSPTSVDLAVTGVGVKQVTA